MARKPAVVRQAEAEPEHEPIAQICATCRHWRPRPNWRHVGECMPSRNGMGQPLVTTDYQLCSAFQWRDDLA